jgi:putative DNA primase/helicase
MTGLIAGTAAVSPTDSPLLNAALDYARHGWPVFPCHPATKRPLTAKGDGGTGGLKLATTDESAIKAWWKRFPKAMIGLPTGKSIGAFVLDIDAGEDEETGELFAADDITAALEAKLGIALPVTWTAETPRGGLHLFFHMPKNAAVGNRAGIIERVDVRGDGGYVVAPPSRRADGRAYRWIVSPW